MSTRWSPAGMRWLTSHSSAASPSYGISTPDSVPRFENGLVPAIAMIVLAIVFGISICLIAAYTGLAIGDEESVQAFGLIWLFPLTFLSSAFVPIATMPGWLQAFANNQPVPYVIDTMRALALGGPVVPSLWKSLVWLAGIFIVFLPLAVRAARRAG